MRLTSPQFLELAFRWAYDHHTRFIEDDQFLPLVKSQGASDSDIERLKEQLEGKGAIENLHWLGGMRDFKIAPTQFRHYLKRVLPPEKLAKARALYESSRRSGHSSFSASVFVEHLGVSEDEASYYLEVLR